MSVVNALSSISERYSNEIVLFIFWILCFLLSIFLLFEKIIEIDTTFAVLLSLGVSAIIFVPIYNQKKNDTILLSYLSKYLLEKDDSNIDELLGLFIIEHPEKIQCKPIDDFFGTLTRISKSDNYYLKRRISEALPALFLLDINRSKQIVEILRLDYDHEKWRADIRRRAIESLSDIIDKEPDFVRRKIEIFDGDEIYTVLSIVEIGYELKIRLNDTEDSQIIKGIISQMKKRNFDNSDIEAIEKIWELLYRIHYYKDYGIKSFDEYKSSPNRTIQIFITRNLWQFCSDYPQRTIQIFQYFLNDPTTHKHVRRPLAKDKSIDCLINLFQNKLFEADAKGIILRLLEEEDHIPDIPQVEHQK
jgi:hypothetical protein